MTETKTISPMVQAPEAPVMVRVDKISKRFGRFRALHKLSFEVRQGEVLGLLGPNGAGKTTAMRVLTGFFPPSSGHVHIGGKDLFKNPHAAKRKIGYLPETISLYDDMRVVEFLRFVADVKDVSKKIRVQHIDEKLLACGLWDVRNRLIGQLSKGYRQRVGLAQALIGDPEILVLDEPTNGLDPKQIIEIRNLIREFAKDSTLILSTHILPEVSMVCDRVLIVNEGKLVASGTTDELEEGLKEQHEVFVTMGDRHRRDEALQMLEGLDGVERVELADERNDQVSFSLLSKHGYDLRPIISKKFVELDLPLYEVRANKLSLEEIFMKIVVKEGQVSARS